MDTSRSHDSYAATMEEALQPAAVSSIEDMEFDRLINGARKSSRFTKQLHVCGMYQDTSMEAMTRAKTKERVERQRRERTIQRINSNFDVNFNYIKRLQIKLAKRQNRMATNIVDTYSALTIQLCFRCYYARKTVRRLKMLKFLMDWFYYGYRRKKIRRCINIVKRSIRHYLFRMKINQSFRQKRAVRTLTCHIKRVMMMKRARVVAGAKQAVRPVVTHILLMGASRARHTIVDRRRSDHGKAKHLISRLVNSYKRYKRNLMLKSERGRVVFFILSKLCLSGNWMNNPFYRDKDSTFIGGSAFITTPSGTLDPIHRRRYSLITNASPYVLVVEDAETASSASAASSNVMMKRLTTIRPPGAPRQVTLSSGPPGDPNPERKQPLHRRPAEVPHGLDRDIYHFIRSKLMSRLVLMSSYQHAVALLQKQKKLRKQMLAEDSPAEAIARLVSVPVEIPTLPEYAKDIINVDRVLLNNNSIVKNPRYRPPPPSSSAAAEMTAGGARRGSSSPHKGLLPHVATSKAAEGTVAAQQARRTKRVLSFSDNNLPHMPAELEGSYRLTSFLDVAQFVVDLVRVGSRDPVLFLPDIPDLLYMEEEVVDAPKEPVAAKRRFDRKGSIYHAGRSGKGNAAESTIYNPNNDPQIDAKNEEIRRKNEAARRLLAEAPPREKEAVVAEMVSKTPFAGSSSTDAPPQGGLRDRAAPQGEEEDVAASLALAASTQPRPPVRQRDPLLGSSPRYRPVLDSLQERSYSHRQIS